MIIIFTDITTAGTVLHQNGDRYLICIPGSGSSYGYIRQHDIRGITHSKILSGHSTYIADSRALVYVPAHQVGDVLARITAHTQGVPTMLTIEIEQDAYLWLYAEIYNNDGDPYYLNPLDDRGCIFLYTGPNIQQIKDLLDERRWCLSTKLDSAL